MKKTEETRNLSCASFSTESIRAMGETIGISSQILSDDAARKLSEDVTDKVRVLVCDALKFQIASKRTSLTTEDIERAMKLHKIEPQYGFQSPDAEPFRFAAGGGRELHFVEEKEANLEEIIMESLPKIPLQARLRTHWLAVDGQQPSIQENPPPLTVAEQASIATNPLIKMDLDNRRCSSTDSHFGGAGGVGNGVGTNAGKPSKLLNTEIVQVKQLAVHELSVEKQMYYKEITEALVSTDAHRRIQALNSLSTDPGLFEICPRLCVFISEGVKVNVAHHNLGALINLVRAVSAIANNPNLYVEKYLHELVPAVITCIVSKQVSECPQGNAHWSLRTYAANLIGRICKTYNNTTNNLQTRVTRIYNNGLENPKMFLTTMYGSLVGLCSLGHEVIKIFIIPKLKTISQRIENKIFNGTPDAMDKLAADRIRTAISTYCSPILAEMREAPDFVDDYRNDYGTCFATALCFGVLQARGTTSNATTNSVTTSAATAMPIGTSLVTFSNESFTSTSSMSLPMQTIPQLAGTTRAQNSNRAAAPIGSRAALTAHIPKPTFTRGPCSTRSSLPVSMAAIFPKQLSAKSNVNSLLKRPTQNMQTSNQSVPSSVISLGSIDEEIIVIDDI